MKKIHYIIPNLYKHGGIQTLAKNTHNALKRYYQIQLNDYFYSLNFIIHHFLSILPEPASTYIFNRYYATYKIDESKSNSNDLIHFWHIDAAIFYKNENSIITCYGEEILPKNLQNYKYHLYKKALIKAKKIIAISNFTKELILKVFSISKDKIEVINPGINYKKLSRIKSKKKNILVIGTISRLVDRKNIDRIIDSLEILYDKHKVDFEYHLAGDGPNRLNILEKLKHVKFSWKYFGLITEKDKFNIYYPNIDIFVLPTLDKKDSIEGFGIVYLEANCFGIPVIASKVGGVIEAVKENVSGLFADPNNKFEIALKIIKLNQNISNYRLSSKKWASQFDNSNTFMRIKNIYDSLM